MWTPVGTTARSVDRSICQYVETQASRSPNITEIDAQISGQVSRKSSSEQLENSGQMRQIS